MASPILALDLGTTTGWALRGSGGMITSGSASFKPGRFEGGGMRFLRFTRWLDDLGSYAPLGGVWFEEVRRHVGTDAAHVYGGLMATLTSWAELRGIPYQGVPVGSWKKSLCGKGNASKDEVLIAVNALGLRAQGFDEADAIGVLKWAISQGGAS